MINFFPFEGRRTSHLHFDGYASMKCSPKNHGGRFHALGAGGLRNLMWFESQIMRGDEN